MSYAAQLAALKRLLDDPSPVVRQAVFQGLQATGTEGVLWLEQLKSDQRLGTHAKTLLADLRTPESAAQALIQYIQAGEIDLEVPCLLLERIHQPKLPEFAYKSELDKLSKRAGELMAEPLSINMKCRMLCRVIFGEEGYRGAPQSFATPESSLLSKVIETRRGIPISLCLILLLVARRLGIPVEPVGLPGRFMVGVFREKEPLYIDCYEGGAFRTRAEVQLLLLDNQLPANEAFLRPVSHPQTIARCCRNLVSQFEAQGDDRSSRLFVGIVHALEKIDERA